MSTSIEIVNGPFDVWAAALDTAYSDISVDAIVAAGWAKIGSSGARHYDEEGVMLKLPQEMEKVSGLGGTEILKILRTLEELFIEFTLFDLSSAEMVKGLNLATSTTDTASGSGVGGNQSFSLLRGLSVDGLAMTIRGNNKSSDLVTENIQIEIPHMVQVASPELVFSKGDKAGLKFELQAIADYTYTGGGSAGDFPYGRMLIGDAVAS
jgi:hypothetical protein